MASKKPGTVKLNRRSLTKSILVSSGVPLVSQSATATDSNYSEFEQQWTKLLGRFGPVENYTAIQQSDDRTRRTKYRLNIEFEAQDIRLDLTELHSGSLIVEFDDPDFNSDGEYKFAVPESIVRKTTERKRRLEREMEGSLKESWGDE